MRDATLTRRLRQRLAHQKSQGRWRKSTINTGQLLNFASNDYLGLAHSPQLQAALQKAAHLPVGSGAAHLISGHHESHHQLESELAQWLEVDDCLLFANGYMANLAVLQTLVEKNDVVISDKLNHASLIDGARFSKATSKRYPHNDIEALSRRLAQAHQKGQQALIVTDGVFSMDGDQAHLAKIRALQTHYQAWLYVDDAHGLGVLGPNGRGTLAQAGLCIDENTVLMGTLGKALGTSGAFVAGSHTLIEALKQLARPYIYTTASAPILTEVTRQALACVINDSNRQAQLHANIHTFRALAQAADLPLSKSMTPIQPLLLGNNAKTMAVAQSLYEAGFWVGAIRPPTVPEGQARLRITLTSTHTTEQIQTLVNVLSQTLAHLEPLEPFDVAQYR